MKHFYIPGVEVWSEEEDAPRKYFEEQVWEWTDLFDHNGQQLAKIEKKNPIGFTK